jgi:hypothetical protein
MDAGLWLRCQPGESLEGAVRREDRGDAMREFIAALFGAVLVAAALYFVVTTVI